MAKQEAVAGGGGEKALDRVLTQIEKQFGKGSIMHLGDGLFVPIAGIPTGSLSLDIALGGNGVPRGRVVELYGPESSGKTTLALSIIAQAQKKGGVAAFIDAEHALDPSWARRIGVNIENLLVSQPDSGEQALEICEMLVNSNALDVVVIDSVAALVPRAEIEGAIGDQFMGLQARLMSQAMRKLTSQISKTHTTVIFINHETTPGGNALKFYSSVRLDTRRIGAIKEGEVVVGSRVRCKVVKNKVAPPFTQAEFDIMFDNGLSFEGDLVDLGAELEVIQKMGAWFSYGDIRLGQGRENTKMFLKENPDLMAEIEKAVRAKKFVAAPVTAPAAEAPAAEAAGEAEPQKEPAASGKGKKK
jgi:recombination protein RecA